MLVSGVQVVTLVYIIIDAFIFRLFGGTLIPYLSSCLCILIFFCTYTVLCFAFCQKFRFVVVFVSVPRLKP